MEPGVGDLRLGFQPVCPKHAEPGGCRGAVQQGSLADPCLATQDQRAALTITRSVKQPRDPRLFGRAPDEHEAIVPIKRGRPVSSAKPLTE
jgi:hypothetical protein